MADDRQHSSTGNGDNSSNDEDQHRSEGTSSNDTSSAENSSQDRSSRENSSEQSGGTRPRRESGGGSRDGRAPIEIARLAARQLGELVGHEPEGVVSLARADEGWKVGVEVVETRRIPDTEDVMAEYQVDVDARGRLMGYRRVRRYQRAKSLDGQ